MNESGVVGIYLSAGKSTRFNGNKLSAPFPNNSLGGASLLSVMRSRLDFMTVITRQDDQLNWIPDTIKKEHTTKWKHIPCAESKFGQAYSLKCGLAAATQLGANAVIVMLADQPFIRNDMVNELIGRFQNRRQRISFIAATCNGMTCPPILFTKQMFPALHQLKGDKGARHLLRSNKYKGEYIPFDPRRFIDVDTQADYRKALNSITKT